MNKKIKIAAVDDDASIHEILHHFISSSSIAEIKYDYTDPQKFLKEAPGLDFDVCFLDISMPGMEGLLVAQLLGNKPVVFITGSDDKLRQAIDLSPIDIITKPFNHERIQKVLSKIETKHIDYGLFNVAESSKKLSIYIPDILFVTADEIDPRNKVIVLKGGITYTLMNYSFTEILEGAAHLVQINRRELIALEIIQGVAHDSIMIKEGVMNIPREVTLSNTHKAELSKRMFYK